MYIPPRAYTRNRWRASARTAGAFPGGAGVTSDPGLARMYAGLRTMRIVDGPDEVHARAIARAEFKKYLVR
jgi:alkylation response protein AidB-like acyl-CoA dehydrogenase